MSVNYETQQRLERLSSLYFGVFEESVHMSTFMNRLKLQKLVYILHSSGIDLGYDFTWYIYGPYSSTLTRDGYLVEQTQNLRPALLQCSQNAKEERILQRMRRARDLLEDYNNAELLASYLYLKEIYGNDQSAADQLILRKPRFTSGDIRKVMDQWHQTETP